MHAEEEEAEEEEEDGPEEDETADAANERRKKDLDERIALHGEFVQIMQHRFLSVRRLKYCCRLHPCDRVVEGKAVT